MTRSKIQVLEKDTQWGGSWVRCCVCSHEFHHDPVDGAPECEWCSEKDMYEAGFIPLIGSLNDFPVSKRRK